MLIFQHKISLKNTCPECFLFSIFLTGPQNSKSSKYWGNDEPGFMTALFHSTTILLKSWKRVSLHKTSKMGLIFMTMPKCQYYFIVKLVKTADTEGIIDSIETVFNWFSIVSFTDLMLELNVDGESVIVGVHRGVGTHLMEKTPWFQLIHCSNHRWTLVAVANGHILSALYVIF